VLAALNIADECFRARDEDAACRASVIQRARELEQMLDLALASDDKQDSPLARTAGSF
jgi:cell division protein ZapA (FtsZ GTPase activity inhibitor)